MSVRRVAMDCLARREHSLHELREKLQQRCRKSPQLEIEQQLSQLRSENLQSDKRFAEALVNKRQAKGYGYLYILQELKNKGLSSELIDASLRADDPCWPQILALLISRRCRNSGNLSYGSKEHLRLVRFLRARGFSASEASTGLAHYMGK